MADQLRQKWSKLAAFIDDSETDVLSHLDFPEQHRTKLHSTDEIDKPQRYTNLSFLFGLEVPFFCPAQVQDCAARSTRP